MINSGHTKSEILLAELLVNETNNLHGLHNLLSTLREFNAAFANRY